MKDKRRKTLVHALVLSLLVLATAGCNGSFICSMKVGRSDGIYYDHCKVDAGYWVFP